MIVVDVNVIVYLLTDSMRRGLAMDEVLQSAFGAAMRDLTLSFPIADGEHSR